MDKKSFINLYSKLSEKKMYKQEASKDVEVFLETVTELLEKGETVKFLNVGSFSILERKPRVIVIQQQEKEWKLSKENS